MQQEDQTLSQENIDAVLKYMDMSPRDALKVEAAKIMRAQRKSEEEIRNAALEEAISMINAGKQAVLVKCDFQRGWNEALSRGADMVRCLKNAALSQGEE